MTHWPDGTPKSSNNAFDWRSGASAIKPQRTGPIPPRKKNLNARDGTFKTYTRAVASTGNFPPVAVSRGERRAATPSTQT